GGAQLGGGGGRCVRLRQRQRRGLHALSDQARGEPVVVQRRRGRDRRVPRPPRRGGLGRGRRAGATRRPGGPPPEPAARATLAAQYDAALAAIPSGAAKTGGIAAGEIAAAAMLAA